MFDNIRVPPPPPPPPGLNARRDHDHTGQCKRTGGCYNELVVAFFSTGGGVKDKKIYTC